MIIDSWSEVDIIDVSFQFNELFIDRLRSHQITIERHSYHLLIIIELFVQKDYKYSTICIKRPYKDKNQSKPDFYISLYKFI